MQCRSSQPFIPAVFLRYVSIGVPFCFAHFQASLLTNSQTDWRQMKALSYHRSIHDPDRSTRAVFLYFERQGVLSTRFGKLRSVFVDISFSSGKIN